MKHKQQTQTTNTYKPTIISKIWGYTKNIIGYASLTNIVKLLALSSAASHIACASAAECQPVMQVPFSCSYPVLDPINPGSGETMRGIIPEINFTTADILCKLSTDYQGAGGVDFIFQTEGGAEKCKLQPDGSCDKPFSSIVNKNETLSLVVSSITTKGLRNPPAIEVMFPSCDYHEKECLSSESSLFISCSPK